MDASFAGLVSICGSAIGAHALHGGLLAGLFLAGAAGSVVHCAPMCGGFVLGQVADNMARVPAVRLCEWRRLRAGLLLPYHLGRLTTYAVLGALAASSVALVGRLPWFNWLSSLLMAAAAAIFLGQALTRSFSLGRHAPTASQSWSRLILWLTRRIGRNNAAGGYLLGLALGLLPCGFVYGAFFAAASAGSWDRGAAAMFCFGLGTVPVLVAIALAGHAANRYWRRAARVMTPGLLVWNAMLLFGAAWLRLAPAGLGN